MFSLPFIFRNNRPLIDCIESKNYYFEIRFWLENYGIALPSSNKESIILGVDNVTDNFIILLYKYSIYIQREKPPTLKQFKHLLYFYEKIERRMAASKNIMHTHNKKWGKLLNKVN